MTVGRIAPEIRRALPSDIPEMKRMAREFHGASCYATMVAANLGDFESMVAKLAQGAGVVLVAEVGGAPRGMTAAIANPHWFNHEHLVGQELFWWVDPEVRNSGAGTALMDALEAWAAKRGCKTFCMASTANLRPEAIGRLYRMRGYVPQDIYYAKEMRCPAQ